MKVPRKCKSYPAPIKVYKWEEKGIFYVYSKSLNITGYGYCKIDADKSFRQQLIDMVKNNKNLTPRQTDWNLPPVQM